MNPIVTSPIYSDAYLRKNYDGRHIFTKISHIVLSLFREIANAFKIGFKRLFNAKSNYHDPFVEINWKEVSKGLCVFIHGLRGHPCCWDSQLNLLRKENDIDLFTPFVPKAGNCSLEEAAEPLLANILSYTEKYPNKPICLTGVSNGSRIATWLEIQLRSKAPKTAVKVSTIAGVHFGTPVINTLEKYKLASFFVKPIIAEELRYGSNKASALIEKLATPLPENVADRSYDFYATTEDLTVPDLGSSLPVLPAAEHFVYHGHGHNTITSAVAKHQIQRLTSWITASTN